MLSRCFLLLGEAGGILLARDVDGIGCFACFVKNASFLCLGPKNGLIGVTCWLCCMSRTRGYGILVALFWKESVHIRVVYTESSADDNHGPSN